MILRLSIGGDSQHLGAEIEIDTRQERVIYLQIHNAITGEILGRKPLMLMEFDGTISIAEIGSLTRWGEP